MRRVVFGFCVAPLTTALAIWACFSLFYLFGIGWFEGKDYVDALVSAYVFGVFATPIAYLVTLLGAVPAFLWMRRRRLLRLKYFIVLGAVLGFLPFVGVFVWSAIIKLWRSVSFFGWSHSDFGFTSTLTKLVSDLPKATLWVVLGVYCGIASAALFWVLAIRSNDVLKSDP